MQTSLVKFSELTESDLKRWHQLRDAGFQFASPFFDPVFTKTVADVRDDVRILVGELNGNIDLFWPMHVTPDRFSRPIGAPFSDLHGPIYSVGNVTDLKAVLESARLSGASYTGVYNPAALFKPYSQNCHGSHTIDLRDGAKNYFAWQQSEYPKHAKKMRRLRRKAEREIGQLDFSFNDRDETALNQIIHWKKEQYQRSGMHDVLKCDWAVHLLKTLFNTDEPGCRGVFHTIRHDGNLIAGEYNIRSEGILHGWFPAYDSAFSSFSPGLLLQDEIIKASYELGIEEIDLGVGADHYKKYYSSYQLPLEEGTIWTNGVYPTCMKTVSKAWRGLERAEMGKASMLAGKIRRRYGVIRDADPTVMGRILGMKDALLHYQDKDSQQGS